MRFPRTFLRILVVGLPFLGSAEAGDGVKMTVKFKPEQTRKVLRPQSVFALASGTTNGVVATVESDAGREEVMLQESDAWLHGAAALDVLPKADTRLTFTLYDQASAPLMSFSGTLGADGAVSLAADATSREVPTSDVELLAAEVFADGRAYALAFDLSGADVYAVAYADVTVGSSSAREVDWEAAGSIWQADATLTHTGVIDVKARAVDANGDTLENVKAELGEPWLDDGEGVSALSAGAGTSVAVTRWNGESDGKTPWSWSGSPEILSLVSDGWTTTSYPSHAELELAGDTVTVPANSYQRHNISDGSLLVTGSTQASFSDSSLSITSGSFKLDGARPSDLGSPLCSDGICVLLVEGDKGQELAVTAYGANPAKIADKRDISLVIYDPKGTKVASQALTVQFDPAVTAVFASELEIDGDPVGGDASGSVSLLGAANSKGKQATLSKGSFYASFSRDTDGDLSLGGYGTDDWATSDTSAGVLLGDPVEDDGNGPPVIAFAIGGRVTKIVVSSGGLDYNAF